MALWRSGQPVPLPRSRKARALLAMLALAPRPLAREPLCDMLWDRPCNPRAELRSALPRLRAVLDEPDHARIQVDGQGGLALSLVNAVVDVRELQAQVRGGAADQSPPGWAPAEYMAEGELLPGLQIDRSPAWGHWLLAERRRVRGLQLALVERMAAHWPAQSDEALAWLNRWLRLLPHDRRAHERLLDALARRGQLHEGDAHLAHAVRLFENEGQDAAGLVRAWREARARHGGGPATPALPAQAAQPGVDVVEPAQARRASVAVMPFEEFPLGAGGGFGRYLAHDVTTQLAKLRSLFVIAQGSTLALGARGLGVEQAARVLDVDYAVSGVVRRRGGCVVLSAQLVHTRSARVLWADDLQSRAAEPFEVLDELCVRTVTAIADQVEFAERQRALLKPPQSLDAWEAHHRGLSCMYRFRREDNELARQWFEAATRLDPGFSRPHAGLSFTHWQCAFQRWGDRETETDLAWRHAHQALLADDRDPAAHWALGRAHWLHERLPESLAELNQAVQLSPSFAQGHYALAFVQSQSGDAAAAIASADQARLLSPFDPLLFGMLGARAMALMRLGRMQEAADFALRATARPNAHRHIRGIAAFCLALADRHDEALRLATALRHEHAGYSVGEFLQAFRFADDAQPLLRRAAAGIGLG